MPGRIRRMTVFGGIGSNGDIVAYRIVEPVAEPEAHMMSAPMEPAPDPVPDQAEIIVSLTAERDALRAEVESLNNELCAARYEASVERLRKGKDDGKLDRSFDYGNDRVDRAACGGDTVGVHGGSDNTGVRLLMTRSNTMDHRLGTQQPDGEPCEPMSARKWRWLP